MLGLGAGELLARGDVFFRAAVGISLFCGIGCAWAACWPPGRQILGRIRHLGPAHLHVLALDKNDDEPHTANVGPPPLEVCLLAA